MDEVVREVKGIAAVNRNEDDDDDELCTTHLVFPDDSFCLQFVPFAK